MRLIALGFAILFSLRAVAQTPVPSPTPTPEPVMIRNAGEQIRWALTDGRAAALSIIRRPAVVVTSNLGYSDSSCPWTVATAPKCKIHFPVKVASFSIAWTANPDATRVGKTVSVFGQPATVDSFHMQYTQLTDKALGADMQPVSLECDDFTFLTGAKDAPTSLRMGSWSGESMVMNPETGAPENMTTIGFFEPLLEKVSDREMKMTSTGTWFYLGLSLPRFWFTGSTILHVVTYPTPGHPACQLSFKPDFSNLRGERDTYMTKYPGPPVPYIEGSDGYFDTELNAQFSFLQSIVLSTEDQWK